MANVTKKESAQAIKESLEDQEWEKEVSRMKSHSTEEVRIKNPSKTQILLAKIDKEQSKPGSVKDFTFRLKKLLFEPSKSPQELSPKEALSALSKEINFPLFLEEYAFVKQELERDPVNPEQIIVATRLLRVFQSSLNYFNVVIQQLCPFSRQFQVAYKKLELKEVIQEISEDLGILIPLYQTLEKRDLTVSELSLLEASRTALLNQFLPKKSFPLFLAFLKKL